MNETIIGIDLGTSNSEVAIVENGQVKVIAIEGNKILPSYVGLDNADNIIVGEAARNQYLLYPERTVKSIKRLMGQNTLVNLGDQQFSPQEISAIIIKQLKYIAEDYLGHPVNKAVITVPAYFSDVQRQATREAGEMADLNIVRIINEPTAATLSYDNQFDEQQYRLVYDLGGGTFDVSIVNMQEGVVEVLASHGDNHLGGDDFDQHIIDFLITHIDNTEGVDIRDNSKAMARISRAAEKAKHTLSTQAYAQIDEEYLLEHHGLAIHLSVELSRVAYENMIEHHIQTTMEAIHIALKDAKLKPDEIDEIILVGGSTRTPCIREQLANQFGFQPHGEIDADLCVCMGAAIQGAMISGQQTDKVLVDISPYSYGTSAIGMLNGTSYPFVYVPIIHKNTALPSHQSDAFLTSRDGQEAVDITIYQGEDPDALNNVKIAEFRVEGLQDTKSGNVITVDLALDLDGILHVTAKEKATGLEKSVRINNALASFESPAIETAKQRISSLFGKLDASLYNQDTEKNEQDEQPEISQVQTILTAAEKIINSIPDADKETMNHLILQIKTAIKTADTKALDSAILELNDMLDYLTE